MKRLLSIILVLVLALSITACGGDGGEKEAAESEAVKPDGTAVLESSGFGTSVLLDQIYVYVGFKVKNTSTNLALTDLPVIISAVRADGTVLNSETGTLLQIAPGDFMAYGSGEMTVSEQPANVTVEVQEPTEENWIEPSTMTDAGMNKLETAESAKGKERFTGVVLNNNDMGIETAAVVILFKNGDGQITAGDSVSINNIPANGRAAYEIEIYGDYATNNYEVFAYPY